jgi:hypothetical protein
MGDQSFFPEFKPIDLEDREIIQKSLWDYQPETSELTFTNLFIWRHCYGLAWARHQDWLLVTGHSPDGGAWALPPIGPPPRIEISRRLLAWLREVQAVADPCLERVDRRLVSELQSAPGFSLEPTRDHFDYVYRSQDLMDLAGGKYHSKRNYINTFKQSYAYRYEPFTSEHMPFCLDLAEAWCAVRRCEEDLGLMEERQAVGEALKNFSALNLKGGIILMEGKVQAFTLGELLNRETAVIHIEKANPEIRGLYAVINQEFCRQAWADTPFINREQDLGEPGLRSAKLSYHPHHLVEKFRVRLG